MRQVKRSTVRLNARNVKVDFLLNNMLKCIGTPVCLVFFSGIKNLIKRVTPDFIRITVYTVQEKFSTRF